MKITIYFASGRINEFDTQNFCTAEPFRGEGSGSSAGARNNICTEFELRFDLLRDQGLCLHIFWYNTVIDDQAAASWCEDIERDVPHAGREIGRIVRLASLEELAGITKIVVDGELAVIRQGSQLINAVKFNAAELMYCSSSPSASMATRVMVLYHYLKNAHPDEDDEALVDRFGFTMAAFDQIRFCEESQPDGDEIEGKVLGSALLAMTSGEEESACDDIEDESEPEEQPEDDTSTNADNAQSGLQGFFARFREGSDP